MAGDRMRLVISGGGTAGHVYPALALLDGWPDPRPEVTWIGTPDGMERSIVTAAGIAFAGVRAGAVRGQRPDRLARSLALVAAGAVQAVGVLRRTRPEVVLTTGGYVSVPVALAARVLRIPLVVFLPDVRPGVAVRAQRRLATRIACAFDAAVDHLPADRTVVTGYPLRPGFEGGDRETARKAFDAGDEPLLLVYGGSRGARSLNTAVIDRIDELLARCRLVHVCGELDHADIARRRAALSDEQRRRYELHAFMGDRLIDAFLAADLGVARAGASTLAELPAAGLPAVVVPGVFSDQQANAVWLAERGAAEVVADEQVPQCLVDTVCALLDDDERRAAMADASRALARPEAADQLRALLEEVAGR
ncbi:MAG TPA: UDP-N-acetylglucosamine--N-acetylmuramyl-(pentapeptide) pyrophosphoryl-undecaprenol N-acetylglucosamine transferase [Euzebyales bacterium]|nr:UDP-N-acetylglucosamine--N-acetylmuramyl-(pentapeptide) pyrophosphoryl-undecaprenol N-acetylglucosamine transferase [Euzebyales bacterium]